MCLTESAGLVIVIAAAALAVMVVRALNKPSVDHKIDRNIYMMSSLHEAAETVLPITPPLSPR